MKMPFFMKIFSILSEFIMSESIANEKDRVQQEGWIFVMVLHSIIKAVGYC